MQNDLPFGGKKNRSLKDGRLWTARFGHRTFGTISNF
jgi:hypothetical protein